MSRKVITDPDYTPTNRERKQYAPKGLMWCHCDYSLVGKIGKCSHCGRDMNNRKRIKGVYL